MDDFWTRVQFPPPPPLNLSLQFNHPTHNINCSWKINWLRNFHPLKTYQILSGQNPEGRLLNILRYTAEGTLENITSAYRTMNSNPITVKMCTAHFS